MKLARNEQVFLDAVAEILHNKSLMKGERKSMNQIARECNLDDKTIFKIFNGKSNAGIVTLLRICSSLDLQLKDVIHKALNY